MHKLYVLTRRDMPLAYAAVQAGHAVAQWVLERKQSADIWSNQTLVYVVVRDEFTLERWCKQIKYSDLTCSKFYEPDLNNQLTAIACLTDTCIFDKLKLMGA